MQRLLPLALVAAIGCTPNEKPDTKPTDAATPIDATMPLEAPDAEKEKTIDAGRKKLAQVIHYKQSHSTDTGNPLMDHMVAMGASVGQLRIYLDLKRRGFKDIFCEGISRDLKPKHKRRKKWRREQRIARKEIFPNGVPENVGNLTDDQKEVFGYVGACLVYWYLNDDVTIHRTQTPAEERKVVRAHNRYSRMLQQGRVQEVEHEMKTGITMKPREQWAAREVKKWLKQNPSQTAPLIYGGDHDFSDDFGSGDNPIEMETIDLR